MMTLTLGQAVRNAIEAENAAASFYKELAGRADDERTRAFFEEMVKVERVHGKEVEDLGRMLAQGAIPADPDTDVTVIETAPEWAQVDGIDIDEALQLALECENQAVLFYGALADHFPRPGAEFFRTLSRAEEQHARMIERTIEERRRANHRPVTIGQAVRNAINAERASAAFYRRLAHRTTDPAARKFLLDMVGVEHLHAAEIERLSLSMKHGPLARHANARIENVETAPTWNFNAELDTYSALRLALDAERHAALYYASVAGYLEGADADFFRQLARTEEEHARMIADTLRRHGAAHN